MIPRAGARSSDEFIFVHSFADRRTLDVKSIHAKLLDGSIHRADIGFGDDLSCCHGA